MTRNIFGIDITDNKENTEIDGEIFVTRRLSPDLKDALERENEAGFAIFKELHLPILVEIFYWICLGLGLIIILGTRFDFKSTIENAPSLLYIGGVCWVTVVYLTIYRFIKRRRIARAPELHEHIMSFERLSSEALEELGIPEESPIIDVFSVMYKRKGNELKQQRFSNQITHVNTDRYIFIEGDRLCLGSFYVVISIPLDSITSMKLCSGKAIFPEWCKDEPFNSPKYKPYHIKQNSAISYSARYYIVTIDDEKGKFELFIPNYEQPIFSKITGIIPHE